MSYKANTTINPGTIYGNPTGSPALGTGIPLSNYTAFTRNQLSATPGPGRSTTGVVTLMASDDGTSLVSTDGGDANYYLPAGLRKGFKVRSYQGGAGKIHYIPATGASILNGSIVSQGINTLGYFVDIENVGSDQWVIINGGVSVTDVWSIAGMPTIKEGDSCTFIITRPAEAFSDPSGATIRVTGTGVTAAGFARDLVETLTDIARLNSNVTFDGVDTLTIKPGSINPIALSFFVVPTYTAIGNRDVTLTIASPSVGSLGTSSSTTTVLNVSKPTDPSELFPPVTATVNTDASGSQANIIMDDVSTLTKWMTVTGDTHVPALTWITAINAGTKTITLSANLTGTVTATTALTFTPPGLWFDFSTSTGITMDGSNRVATATDKINGYTINQATTGNKPIYLASAWNSLGGLQFNGTSQNLATSTSAPLFSLFNDANHHITRFLVLKRNTGTSNVGNYGTFMGSCHNSGYAHSDFESISEAQANGIALCFTNWDGAGMCNGQPFWTFKVTLTANFVKGGTTTATVDDATSLGLPPFGGSHVSCKVMGSFNGSQGPTCGPASSSTTLPFSTAPGTTVPAGTTINVTGSSGAGGLTSAQTGTLFEMGCTSFSTGQFTVLELIVVPRMLTPQQLRGVHLYIANKWGASVTTTVSAGVPESANKDMGPAWRLPLTSLTGICQGQVISATTGIAEGTTVIGINPAGNIEIDTAIQSPGITSGATLTFTTPSFKKPRYLDASNYDLIYRDDFSTGFRQWDGAQGWTCNQGTYWNYPYNNTAFGYIDFNTFYPDPSYAPWVPYNPFALDKSAGAETGQLLMTLSPTPPVMQTALTAGGAGVRSAIGGLPTNQQEFRMMHGYYECRMKVSAVSGAWPAFWLTVAVDQPIYGAPWPPELDILEQESNAFASGSLNLWGNPGHVSNNNNTFNTSPCQDTFGPLWAEHMLIGCEITPNYLDLFVNREFVRRVTSLDDTPIFWCMDIDNNFTFIGSGAWDGVTHIPLYVDHVVALRKKQQSPSVSGSTQAETTALLAAMSVQPSGPRTTLINALISSLKTYRTGFGLSFWDALDFLYIPAAHDAQAGRINWKSPSNVGSVVGSPAFQTDRGYTGDSGVSYIDTGKALATAGFTLTQSNNHIGSVINNVSGAPQSTSVGTVGCAAYYIQPTNLGKLLVYNLGATANWNGGIYDNILQVGLGTNTVPANQTAANCHIMSSRNFAWAYTYINGNFSSGNNGVAGSGNYVAANQHATLSSTNMYMANSNYQTACFHGGVFLTADDARDLYSLLYVYLHALGAL